MDGSLPEKLPILLMADTILFPGMTLPIRFGEASEVHLFQGVLSGAETNTTFGVLFCKTYRDEPDECEPFLIGTTAEVERVEQHGEDEVTLTLMGKQRFLVTRFCQEDTAYLYAEVSPFPEEETAAPIDESLLKEVKDLYQAASQLVAKVLQAPHNVFDEVDFPHSPERLSYYIAESLNGSLVLKQEILEIPTTQERLQREKDLMWESVRRLSARAQIESAFRSPPESSTDPSDPPPTGGEV